MPDTRRRRWRDYRRELAADLWPSSSVAPQTTDAAVVVAAMKEVAEVGLEATRHVRGDIYEVRADGDRVIYRILFSTGGRRGQVLLALEGYSEEDAEDAGVGDRAGGASHGLVALAPLSSLRG